MKDDAHTSSSLHQNNNPSYPTALLDASTEGHIAVTLRELLDSNGLEDVWIMGAETNWNSGSYPGDVVRRRSSLL